MIESDQRSIWAPDGDRALCRLAQTLADCCRSVDTAARQGGDEFAVVLQRQAQPPPHWWHGEFAIFLRKMPMSQRFPFSVGVASYPRMPKPSFTLLYARTRPYMR